MTKKSTDEISGFARFIFDTLPSTSCRINNYSKDEICINVQYPFDYLEKNFIIEDFYDSNGKKNGDLNVFGKDLDYIKFNKDEKNNKYWWEFDFEDAAVGAIVTLYNSLNKNIEPIIAPIGNNDKSTDKLYVPKSAFYDRFTFTHLSVNVKKIDNNTKYEIKLPVGKTEELWRQLEDEDYITEDWINLDENNKITGDFAFFKEDIDWIKYHNKNDKCWLEFDTEGSDTKLNVCIYNSKDRANTEKKGTIGEDSFFSRLSHSTEKVYIDKNQWYDTIEVSDA